MYQLALDYDHLADTEMPLRTIDGARPELARI
jgi:hypothetical protein